MGAKAEGQPLVRSTSGEIRLDEFDRVDLTYSDRNTRLPEGSEYSYSGFMQVKHYFLPQLILNG